MANEDQDLNVFEILGEKEPDSKKPPHEEPEEWNEWSKYFENRIEEQQNQNTSGQEQNAPDRFFDEETIQAIFRARPQTPPIEKHEPIKSSAPIKKREPTKNSVPINKNGFIKSSTSVKKHEPIKNSAPIKRHEPTKNSVPLNKNGFIKSSASVKKTEPVKNSTLVKKAKSKHQNRPLPMLLYRLLKKRKPVAEMTSRNWRGILAEIAVVVLAIVLITQFFISISYVSGDSMLPAFHEGDRVVIQRFAKGSIEKGDVIVFETEQGEKLIKRVIAMEGDTVDISKTQGGLYINGEAVEEDYIYTATTISDEQVIYPVTVGEDSYFVLGDNRTNSKDSRNMEIGLVEKKDIIGKVILSIRSKTEETGETNEATAGQDTQ